MKQKVIVAKIFGGLGNQMFQYAFGASAASLHNAELLLDIGSCKNTDRGFMLGNFNLTARIATDSELDVFKDVVKLRKGRFLDFLSSPFAYAKYLLQHNCRVPERGYTFNKQHFEFNGNAYVYGAWQSSLYFTGIKEHILEQYTLKHELDTKNLETISKITAVNSVSIHVRRGDYISDKYKDDYANLDIAYYKDAMSYIESNCSNPIFFIFSNDINWCKNNFGYSDKINYIDHNDEKNGHIDMHLMAQCKHNIIANSTFSWWGAWLNQNKNKVVICPSKWFGKNLEHQSIKDLYEQDWIII
jgi:hypothetical protein